MDVGLGRPGSNERTKARRARRKASKARKAAKAEMVAQAAISANVLVTAEGTLPYIPGE